MFKKIIQYLRSVQSEMAKVSWPARNEVVSATLLVVSLSLVMTIIVYGFDMILVQIVGLLLKFHF